MVEQSDLDFVANQIIRRYAHPSRTAYLYAFRLQPDADVKPLVPRLETIIAAWVDEGDGLNEIPAYDALVRCDVARSAHIARPANTHERRLSMARMVAFRVAAENADQISVELLSRALAFTPKGDRHVTETWRHAEGSWFSAPIGRE